MGVQLVDVVEEFDQNMPELLAKPGHGSCLFHWSTCLVGGTRTRGAWLIRWKQKIRSCRKLMGAVDCHALDGAKILPVGS
jgi:hypothetical protein